jgi:hypothetical protein
MKFFSKIKPLIKFGFDLQNFIVLRNLTCRDKLMLNFFSDKVEFEGVTEHH